MGEEGEGRGRVEIQQVFVGDPNMQFILPRSVPATAQLD